MNAILLNYFIFFMKSSRNPQKNSDDPQVENHCFKSSFVVEWQVRRFG